MAKKDISTKKSEVFLVKTDSKAGLSKNQITFNNLSKKIETLRLQIIKTENEAEYKLNIYHNTIHSIEAENIESKLKFVKFLFNLSKVEKLSKKQHSNIEQCIAILMNEIISEQEIDDELKEIYNFYNNTNYDEEVEEEMSDAKSMIENQLKEELGIEIDLSEFNFSDTSPNNYAKMQEMIQEAMQEKFGEDGFKNSKYGNFKNDSKPKKKTKAELKREELEKQKEELKNKSIRSIYVALAKILHPDIETDIDKKLEKEELMKQVVIAYENKDLTTLLKLEMQWIYNEENTNLSEEKLNIYIEVLREQANELETQKYNFYRNERFEPIFDFRRHSKKQFETAIASQSDLIKEETELINDAIFEPTDFKIYKTNLFQTIEYLIDKMRFENQFYDILSF